MKDRMKEMIAMRRGMGMEWRGGLERGHRGKKRRGRQGGLGEKGTVLLHRVRKSPVWRVHATGVVVVFSFRAGEMEEVLLLRWWCVLDTARGWPCPVSGVLREFFSLPLIPICFPKGSHRRFLLRSTLEWIFFFGRFVMRRSRRGSRVDDPCLRHGRGRWEVGERNGNGGGGGLQHRSPARGGRVVVFFSRVVVLLLLLLLFPLVPPLSWHGWRRPVFRRAGEWGLFFVFSFFRLVFGGFSLLFSCPRVESLERSSGGRTSPTEGGGGATPSTGAVPRRGMWRRTAAGVGRGRRVVVVV